MSRPDLTFVIRNRKQQRKGSQKGLKVGGHNGGDQSRQRGDFGLCGRAKEVRGKETVPKTFIFN